MSAITGWQKRCHIEISLSGMYFSRVIINLFMTTSKTLCQKGKNTENKNNRNKNE
jgi:hypothetical protein